MPKIFVYTYFFFGDSGTIGNLSEIDKEQSKSKDYLFVPHGDSNLDKRYKVMFDLSKIDTNEVALVYLTGDYGYSPALISKGDKTYEMIKHLHPLLDAEIPIAMREQDFDPKMLAARKQNIIFTTRKILLPQIEKPDHSAQKIERTRKLTQRAKALTKRMMVINNFLNLTEYEKFEEFLSENPEDQENVDEMDEDILTINSSAKASDYPNSLRNMAVTKGGSMINHFILEPAMLAYFEEKIDYLEELNSRFTTFKYKQNIKKRKHDNLSDDSEIKEPEFKRPKKK